MGKDKMRSERMEGDVLNVLISCEELCERITAMGAEITADYSGRRPMFVGILKGCFIFMADLLRSVDLYCDMDFMAVSSYGDGTSTTGAVKITKDLSRDIAGRDIIIVEDILDSGITLSYIKGYLELRGPASVKIVTLLDKPSRRKADIKPDYCCFTVPDEFVIGYGLDFAEEYRNLPYIGVLKPEIYTD